jgi:uncharacterized membrane protein YphA (DoxX/SURF4 family)
MPNQRTVNVLLWTAQWLLALFFALGSGAPKLLLTESVAASMPIPLPQPFLVFIGVSEILGGLGLVLPGLLRILVGLTPLAAAGLVVVTVSATVYQLLAGWPESALFAVAMGLVTALVGYARWRVAPLRAAAPQPALQAAA